MTPIRIILADDHTIVRQGIRSLLEAIPEFEVIAEASDGIQAVELIGQEMPDIALMDIMMPNLNGLDATKQIVQRKLPTKIIILSMHANSAYAVRALRNGALGYVLKDADQNEIVAAIQAVMQDRRYISPQFSDEVISALITTGEQPEDLYEELTLRERQVLQMIAEGNTNKTIAEKLVLSTRTVEVHRANLMTKLKISSQAELVRFAIQRGLVSLEPPLDPE